MTGLGSLRRIQDSELPRALLIIQEAGHFNELIRVAKLFRSSRRFQPIFMFRTTYPALRRDQNVCRELGIAFFDECYVVKPKAPIMSQRYWHFSLAPFTYVARQLFCRWRLLEKFGTAFTWLHRLESAILPAGMRRALKTLAKGLAAVGVFGHKAFLALGRGIRKGGILLEAGWMRLMDFVREIARRSLEPFRMGRNLRHQFRRFRRLTKQIEPKLIVLGEDNVGHATGIFTRVAREIDAAVLVIPYTIANALEFAESFYSVPEHQFGRWPNWLVGSLMPRWTYTHKGRRLLRLPGWTIIAHELLKIAPRRPWVYNSGDSDAIAVESQRTADYYREAGLTSENLVVTGAPFDDDLAHQLAQKTRARRDLYRSLSINDDKPMLLCALPPNQLPSRPQTPYATFDSLLRSWLEPLKDVSSFNVVIRLHPRVDRASVPFIEEMGFKIAEEDTARLVPLCDLYLASVSATIRWAIACGVPVLNYDIYRYHYTDYDSARGVLTVEDGRSYQELLHQFDQDTEFLHAMRLRQQDCQYEWGRLDGKSGGRLLDLIDSLLVKTERIALENRSDYRHGPNGPKARASRQRIGA